MQHVLWPWTNWFGATPELAHHQVMSFHHAMITQFPLSSAAACSTLFRPLANHVLSNVINLRAPPGSKLGKDDPASGISPILPRLTLDFCAAMRVETNIYEAQLLCIQIL